MPWCRSSVPPANGSRIKPGYACARFRPDHHRCARSRDLAYRDIMRGLTSTEPQATEQTQSYASVRGGRHSQADYIEGCLTALREQASVIQTPSQLILVIQHRRSYNKHVISESGSIQTSIPSMRGITCMDVNTIGSRLQQIETRASTHAHNAGQSAVCCTLQRENVSQNNRAGCWWSQGTRFRDAPPAWSRSE